MSYHDGDAFVAPHAWISPRDAEPVALGRAAPQDMIALARSIAAARRMRGDLLDADLFAEPAWDLLLDLYVATRAGGETPVAIASLATGVPASVSLRWIKELETRGLIERRISDDRRQDRLRLSPEGADRMDDLLRAMLDR